MGAQHLGVGGLRAGERWCPDLRIQRDQKLALVNPIAT